MSFLSSIPIWGWLDIGFTLLVLMGIGGESEWAGKSLFPEKISDLMPPNSKRKKLKSISELLVIFGIAGEVVCLAISLNESAALNERASKNELTAKQLETQLNETKTQLANAETRLNESVIELQKVNSPMDIGDGASFSDALKTLGAIRVELRYFADTNARRTANDLYAVFAFAGWSILNRSPIDDIGQDGIVIGYNGEDSAKKAAYLLLKLLTERDVPSKIIEDPLGIVARSIPTNSIIVAVCQRPNQLKTKLMEVEANETELAEQFNEISTRMKEIASHKYASNSQALAEAQSKYDSLGSQSLKLYNEFNALVEQDKRLIDQINKNENATNSPLSILYHSMIEPAPLQ
jgi:hypothetical protein